MKLKCCRTGKFHGELTKSVEFLKVIAEENRLKILCMLSKEEMCVCEIWQYLDLSQNLVSHHLKILRDFKLIKSRKEGLKVYYSINQIELSKYNSSLNSILRTYEK